MMIDVPGRIARSEFRKEIDDMLSEGETYTAISNWLRNNGEVISRELISKYHRFCFNTNVRAAELYTQEESEARLTEAAKKQVNTLHLYDKLIEAGADVVPTLVDERSRIDFALKAAKQREDFLREHGDSSAEEQTQILKDIRDELIKGSLTDIIEGISNERVKKRVTEATTHT
jgi:putative cell wall-binding protein